MQIYVIKPNSLHPDAMHFLKEKALEAYPGAKLLENQSGPAYDPNMINRCDGLFVAIGTDRSIGKGVYGEVTDARENSKEVRIFEFDLVTKKLNPIPEYKLKVKDSNNFRQFGTIEGTAVASSEAVKDEDLI